MEQMLKISGGMENEKQFDSVIDAIENIINCSAADTVKQVALETLRNIASVENLSISNCTFTNK